jgi:hypothetical protein
MFSPKLKSRQIRIKEKQSWIAGMDATPPQKVMNNPPLINKNPPFTQRGPSPFAQERSSSVSYVSCTVGSRFCSWVHNSSPERTDNSGVLSIKLTKKMFQY